MSNTAIDSIAIGDAMRAKALSFAAATGAAIDAVVVDTADIAHENSLAPIKLYWAMMSGLTDEQRNDLPLPGLRWKDAKTGSLNNNPAIAEWKDPAKPDSKAKEIDFYVVWSDNTPEGKRVADEIEWCKIVGDDKMKRDGIPAAWLKKYDGNPADTAKRLGYLTDRRKHVRKQYKEAIRIIWQLDMCNELQGVECSLNEADKTDNKVEVTNKANPKREWMLMKISSFLKLNPVVAAKNGGTYAALKATAERKRDPGGNRVRGKGVTIDSVNAIKTPAQLDIVGVAMLHSLDKAWSDKNGSEYSALLKHLTGPGGAQSAHTLLAINNILNGLFKMDNIRAIAETEMAKAA